MDLYDDASDYGDYDGEQDEDDVDDEDLNEEEGKLQFRLCRLSANFLTPAFDPSEESEEDSGDDDDDGDDQSQAARGRNADALRQDQEEDDSFKYVTSSFLHAFIVLTSTQQCTYQHHWRE